MASCPRCGRATEEGASYCSACGARLARNGSPIPQARKTVTVLFADVSGFTALGERLDPESLQQLMSRYFAEMSEVVGRHGGTVEKLIGDAIMAVFGVPPLHQGDAPRAPRGAPEMHTPPEGGNKGAPEGRGAPPPTPTG